MSNRTNLADATKNLLLVPLDKLKKSPKNVRKVPHTKAEIRSLAASIGAIGMLQFPVVEPETGPRGKPTGFYLVNAGEGRRLAQALRAKRKEIKADAPVTCILDTEHNGTELSLAENAVRCEMHPADQYEAFAKLHNEDGMSAEDIAARFGVTPAVVRQCLKLGAVSPKLIALYRKGEMTLEQLSAFAITEDHERQERVWTALPRFQRSREAILRALSEGQVRSDDRRALFVGAKAYEAAGGVIIRDLFDKEGGGFFADAELLDRLAREKLEQAAESITKEGWRWVVAGAELDRETSTDMRRVLRSRCRSRRPSASACTSWKSVATRCGRNIRPATCRREPQRSSPASKPPSPRCAARHTSRRTSPARARSSLSRMMARCAWSAATSGPRTSRSRRPKRTARTKRRSRTAPRPSRKS
jgi:ParB family chromosome partitioning protein